MPNKVKYKNTNYIHEWHLAEEQQIKAIIIEPGRFFTKECLNGQEWWNCIVSTYL